jgi:tetratricopeptide (TPR) repeat protein
MRKTRLTRRDFLFGFRNRFSKADGAEPSSLTNQRAKEADKLLKEGNFERAEKVFKELLKDRSDNLVARQKLAYCLYKTGKIVEAKKEFLTLKKMGIKSNFMCLYLGLCFAHEGKLKEAIETFKEFFDVTKPVLQRAINLQIALFDSNMANKEDMIKSIEEAILEQNKMDKVSI